jgi:hypothetical protein
LEIWADPNGHGTHSDYFFDDVRLEDWYSLVQLRQPAQGIEDIRFHDVAALEAGSSVASVLKGSVRGVSFDNVTLANKVVTKDEDLPLKVSDGASAPTYSGDDGDGFTYSSGLIVPGRKVKFQARTQAGAVRYEWSFGDGTRATGRVVQHAFADVEGTMWDHSGRFRVLLRTVDANGRSRWTYEPVVVAKKMHPAISAVASVRGVHYQYAEGTGLTVDGLAQTSATAQGVTAMFDFIARGRDDQYGMVFDGLVDIPADGGYTFTLMGNDGGSLEIDSVIVASSPKPWAQVCGSPGGAVQAARGSIALATGKHRIRVAMTHPAGPDGFRVLWQGPGVPQGPIPAAALSHKIEDEKEDAPVVQ